MTGNSSESGTSGRTNNRRFKDKITKQWAIFCGDCGPLRNYVASKSFNSRWAVVKFLDALFRGYGQVVLANNPISGILIFIGLIVADPIVSATGLLTACVGLLVSIWVIPQPKDVVANGLTVFNPLLIGLVTGSLLPTVYGIEIEYWHFFNMIVATVICVYVTAAIGNILNSISRHPLPYLSLPFNVVQQLLFLLLITLGPAKIDISTTTVEPHLLNNSMSHETFENIPIVASSLVSPEILIQSKDSVTVLSSEWSDSRNLDHNQLSQMDAATEEYTKKFKDEVESNHMIQNNTPAIENFDVDRGTEFMKTKDLSDGSMRENPTSLKLEDSSNGHHSSLVTNRSENNFLDLDVDDGEKDFREERSVADEELLDLANMSNNSNADEEPPIEVDWGGVFSGIVLSMSQAYACNYAPTSVLIYLAVLIYSPITAGFGLVGATVGTVAGVFLTEADTYSAAGGVYDGSWGFNGVLAGMCLGGLFFVISWSSTAITILGVLFTSILQYVFLPSFTRADLLILTLPFNISTLLFLCVTSGNLVRPKAISFPEKQRREYRQLDSSEKNSRDQLSSASADDLAKDSELEKKLAHAEVV